MPCYNTLCYNNLAVVVDTMSVQARRGRPPKAHALSDRERKARQRAKAAGKEYQFVLYQATPPNASGFTTDPATRIATDSSVVMPVSHSVHKVRYSHLAT